MITPQEMAEAKQVMQDASKKIKDLRDELARTQKERDEARLYISKQDFDMQHALEAIGLVSLDKALITSEMIPMIGKAFAASQQRVTDLAAALQDTTNI